MERLRRTPDNHEVEGNRTPTAVMDETYSKQADASKGRLSRLGKSVIAATTTAIAAVGSGIGLVLSSGGEKIVKSTKIDGNAWPFTKHVTIPPPYPGGPSYDKTVVVLPQKTTTNTIHTTNGLEHGLGWGLIGGGLATLALAGAGILINRYMQKKNSNRN